MTKLVMHYAPGILAVLKRHDCPGRPAHFGGTQHGPCACDSNHQVFTIAGIHLLEGDEASWCLERSWIPRQSAQLDTRAVS